MVAAYALYHRRRSESAGDVVSVGWMKPVFRYGVSICSAMAGGLALYAIFWGSFQSGDSYDVIPLVIAMLMAGFVVLYFCKATIPVFLGTLILLCGYLAGMAMFGAIIRDKTPDGKAGMFQGLRIVGQVLVPGVIGPAIGAAVLKNADTVLNNDGTTSFIPNESIYLAALLVAVVLTASLIVALTLGKKKEA